MLRSSGVALVLFSFLVTSVNSQTNDVPNAEPTFQSKVRLVLLDITVTDKNDQPVSGLKQEDFEVFEEGKPQTIDSFEEHKGAPPAAAEPTPLPMNVYSNTPPPRSSDSVNVLVLDALNTELADQSYVHKQMADYLKEVQPGTRLAIFTLSSQLRMVEGFTADPSVLIAALNHKNWGGGPQSSQMLRTQSEDNTDQQLVNDMAGMPGNAAAIAMMKQFLEESKDFEKYQRVQTTLFALQELGRYLGGFPGRKNLIWFSGSFPIDILPTQGQNYDFSFSDQYKQQLRETTNLLAAAQVAIYPISAQGIDNDAYYQASYNFKPDLSDTSTSSQGQGQSQNQSQANGGGSSGMLAHAATLDQNKQLQAEHSERHANEDSMDEIAKDTGGKAFYNTNGLKDAMAHVISNGTHYYTISYSPTDKSLDGKYRPITVKLRDAKYKLAYRRGYFSDTTKSAEQKSSNGNPLLPLMARGMPDATQILYQVHVSPKDSQPSEHSPVASDNAKFQGPAIRYGADFDVEAKDLSLEAGPDGTRHGSLEASLVVYDHDSNLLNWIARRIELSYAPDRYAAVERSGIPFDLEIDAPKGDIYLRTGIYETSTSKAGTLEIPLNAIKLCVKPAVAQAPSQSVESATNVEHPIAPQVSTPAQNPANEVMNPDGTVTQSPASAQAPVVQPIETAKSEVPPPTESSPSPFTVKASSRLVVVDVVARDRTGGPARYLKEKNFQISEKVDWVKEVPQKIINFRTVDTSHYAKKKPAELVHPPAGIYSNLVAKEDSDIPLTVLLLDGLNSNLYDPEISKQIEKMSEAIPNTPMAVFLLSDRLALLQDFTTDQKSLHAAVSKIYSVGPFKTFRISDSTGPSLDLQERFGVPFNSHAPVLEHWDRRIHGEGELDRRVHTTLDAMRTIARHLAGYPGRKKLIWVSSSFPFSIGPGNFANFTEESRTFHDQIEVVTNSLSNARVAVYPADPGGLWTSNVCSASTISCPQGAQYAAIGRTESLSHLAAVATMEEFATQTGGAACFNDNSLADCVRRDLDDGSFYYELTYAPSPESWKEGFHRIVVKASNSDISHLAFRRGYYAGVEERASNTSNGTDSILKQAACNDVMAATALPFTVQPLNASSADMAKYEFFVDGKQFPSSDSSEKDQPAKIHLDLSVCTFDANGKVLQYIQKPIDAALTGADYAALRTNGIRRSFEFQPTKGVAQLRVLVRDVNTGDLGSIDLPYPNTPVAANATPAASTDPVILSASANIQSNPQAEAVTVAEPVMNASEIKSYCKSIGSSAEHSAALADVCEFALTMRKKLPDVICDREMQRHWRMPGDWQGGAYARRDTVTAKVAYRNGVEYYDDLKVDGKSVEPNARALVGSTYSSGEFAMILGQIFSPLSDAEFKFEKEETFHSIPALVFKFDVQQQNNQVYYLHIHNGGGLSASWFPAYHGWMWLDKETFQLLKLQRVTTEMPYMPIRRADTEIEYAKVSLGDGSDFVLPTNSDVLTCSPQDKEDECAHNLIKFTNWHKFRAKSQILMDPTQ